MLDVPSRMPAPSSVTRPKRNFTPEALQALETKAKRQLVQALIEESGGRVVNYRNAANHVDLAVTMPLFWADARIRVRVALSEVTQRDAERLSEAVLSNAEDAGWLIATMGSQDLQDVPRVSLCAPEELIARLEHSFRIAWTDRVPSVAMPRLRQQRDLDARAHTLDPIGLRWLPTLAHNELPADLSDEGSPPQDWLERFAFRIFTHALRFGGERFGEAARGKRFPDALINWNEAGVSYSALMDSKSSADGYVMEADHLLRFIHYADLLREQVETSGSTLKYMIVLSSEFRGSDDGRHPFHGRAKSLLDRAGLELVYLRAIDLVTFVCDIEQRDLTPSDRESLLWSTAFEHGMVAGRDLKRLLPEAAA